MQRTKKKQKVHFQKVGGGSLRLPGRIIKPNQKFWADPDDIPKAFKDSLIQLSDAPVADKEEKQKEPIELFEIKERETAGWYDVVNKASGKTMNENALRKKAAEELKQSLE